MSQRYNVKVEAINPCMAPRCHAAAVHRVTNLDGRYPTLVCDRHVNWGKQRVREIESS